jgi:hypothetical protein
MRPLLTLALLLLLISPVIRAADTALVAKTVLDGRVTLLVPGAFKPMSQEQILKKYTRPNPPAFVYANEPGTVSIALEHTKFAVKTEQLPQALAEMKKTMQQQIPTATWYRSELVQINGHTFVLMDMRTPAAEGDEVHNIMAATSLDDRLMIVSFNVTRKLEADWLATGNRIIESIHIK